MRVTFWRLQLIGWTAFWVAMAGSRVGRFPLSYMIASKGVFAALGCVISGVLLRPLYKRFLNADASLVRTIVITASASYVAAALWTAADSFLDLPISRAFLSSNAHISSIWQVFGGTLYDAFALLSWSVLYVAIKHQQAMQAERERALRAEALAQSVRLDALRSQISPHCLFNSLNAISTLVLDGRSTEAATMIARVADLLRTTLRTPDDGDVPLSDEIDVVRRYLEIEQVRLGDRMHADVVAEGSAMKARVPSLILQPLVENAVRHAVAERERGGRIVVSAQRRDGRLHIAVEDDGPGLSTDTSRQPRSERTGIGIANTRERLAQHYGRDQRFSLERGPLGGLRVVIELPYRE
jgi:signal transduction histidine kinase